MQKLKEMIGQYQGLRHEVYIIFVAKIVNAMGCFVFPLLALILTDKIGLSKSETGKLMSLFGILFIPASMIGGKLCDVIGRKKIILICDFMAILSYAICGFIEPSMKLVYFIMAGAFFLFMADPAHSAMLADLTKPEDRERAYSLTYMGWNIGFAIGPVLGGLLYKNHLKWVFRGDALTAFVAFLLIAFFVKETIEEGQNEEALSKEEAHMEGSIFGVMKKRPLIVGLALVSIAYSFAYGQWGFVLPIHSVLKDSAMGAQYYGYMAGFNGLIVIIFTPILTQVAKSKEALDKIIVGGWFYVIGFGVLGLYNPYWMFFVSVFIFTIGEIILAITMMPFIMNQTPANHRGRMNAILPIVMYSGNAFGPMVMGYYLEQHTIEQGWLLTGGFAGVGVILMILIKQYHTRSVNLIKEDVA